MRSLPLWALGGPECGDLANQHWIRANLGAFRAKCPNEISNCPKNGGGGLNSPHAPHPPPPVPYTYAFISTFIGDPSPPTNLQFRKKRGEGAIRYTVADINRSRCRKFLLKNKPGSEKKSQATEFKKLCETTKNGTGSKKKFSFAGAGWLHDWILRA